jgi:hypothetical protein
MATLLAPVALVVVVSAAPALPDPNSPQNGPPPRFRPPQRPGTSEAQYRYWLAALDSGRVQLPKWYDAPRRGETPEEYYARQDAREAQWRERAEKLFRDCVHIKV